MKDSKHEGLEDSKQEGNRRKGETDEDRKRDLLG